MVTSPVMILLMPPSFLVWLIVMGEGAGGFIFLGGGTVVMWLAIIPCTFIHITLVLYFCTVGTWVGFTLYCCGAFGMTSVLSGIMCDAFCDGFRLERPRVIKVVSSFPSLLRVSVGGSGEVILVVWYVYFTLCSVTGGCSTLRSYSGWDLCGCGTAVLNICASCRSASVSLFPRCVIGMDGVECSRSYVISSAARVTASVGDRLGGFSILRRVL